MTQSKLPKKARINTIIDFSDEAYLKAIGEPIPQHSKLELEEAKNEYLIEKRVSGLSEHTLRSYDNSLGLAFTFIDDTTKKKPLMEWTQKDLDNIMANIISGKKMKTDEPLSDKTRETYLRNLRQFVKWLEQNEYVKHGLYVRKFKAAQAPPKMYTEEELYILSEPPQNIARCSFMEIRNYIMVMVLIETGIRKRSLINIRICDVDTTNNQIQIVKSKNKEVYCVRFSENVSLLLKKYIAIRMDKSEDDTAFLFCDSYQRPLTPSGVTNILKKYIENKGVKFKGLHSFRHSMASLMVKNGANIADVAQQTGHKDLRQVQGYIHAVTAINQEKFSMYSPLANKPKQSNNSYNYH